eukprot:349772-Chlamydomonas_euryale.AAC.2
MSGLAPAIRQAALARQRFPRACRKTAGGCPCCCRAGCVPRRAAGCRVSVRGIGGKFCCRQKRRRATCEAQQDAEGRCVVCVVLRMAVASFWLAPCNVLESSPSPHGWDF